MVENECSPNLRWPGTGVAGQTLGTIVSLHGTLHMISLSFSSSYTFNRAPHPPRQPGLKCLSTAALNWESPVNVLPNETVDGHFQVGYDKNVGFKEIEQRGKKHE